MIRKLFPSNVLEQARTIINAWNQIGAEVPLGNSSLDSMVEKVNAANALVAQMESLELQLTNLRNQRDELFSDMWDNVKRVRFGVRANYGDDSTEYEMVGGTRLSERKSPVRRSMPLAE